MKKHVPALMCALSSPIRTIQGLLIFIMSIGMALPSHAIIWNAAVSTETAYPAAGGSSVNLDNGVTHISSYARNSNRFGQYIELAGWSKDIGTGGGGFTYGLASSGMPYVGQGIEIIPNAVDVRVGYLENDNAYIVVAYFDKVAGNYYCRLYPWLAPTLLGVPTTYLIYSGTIDYRCNLDVNYMANKVAISLCTNNALFTAVGILAGGGIQFSPGMTPVPAIMINVASAPGGGYQHAAADVAFQADPSGNEMLHYAYFCNTIAGSKLRHIEIPFNALFGWMTPWGNYTYTGPVDDIPAPPAAPMTIVVPRLDCPDFGPSRWAYAYTTDNQNIMVRLSPGIDINLTNGSMGPVPINGFLNTSPSLAFDQMGSGFFVAWGTRATSMNYASNQSYVALELNAGGGVVSSLDYLLVAANPNTDATAIPLVALSRHGFTMNDLYTAFTEYPSPFSADAVMEHKNHPWSSSTAWRGTGVGSVTQQASELGVAPNPFHNNISITSTDKGQTTVAITDLFGRQLAQYKGELAAVNNKLSQLGNTIVPGTYMLAVTQGQQKGQVFKIVKQ